MGEACFVFSWGAQLDNTFPGPIGHFVASMLQEQATPLPLYDPYEIQMCLLPKSGQDY